MTDKAINSSQGSGKDAGGTFARGLKNGLNFFRQ